MFNIDIIFINVIKNQWENIMIKSFMLFSLFAMVLAANANIYIVKKGDSLSQISQLVTGTYKNYMIISEENNIKDPNIIFVDQELNIPEYLVTKNENTNVLKKNTNIQVKDDSIVAKKDGRSSDNKDFPKLEKKNLKDITDKIMDKIDTMREQRRKNYLKKELIKDKVSSDKFEDAKTANDKIDVEDLNNENEGSLDDYIVKLNTKDNNSKIQMNSVKHKEINKSSNIIKRKFAIELGCGFSHEPVSDAGSDILPGVAIKYNNTGVSCLGLRYSKFDNTKNKIKFEYDKLTAFYRYFPSKWESNKNSFFFEGAISYLDSDYTLVLLNRKMNDKVADYELSIGDEYFFTKNFSMEFKLTGQVASAEFDNSGSKFNESLNDTYLSTAANFYF